MKIFLVPNSGDVLVKVEEESFIPPSDFRRVDSGFVKGVRIFRGPLESLPLGVEYVHWE